MFFVHSIGSDSKTKNQTKSRALIKLNSFKPKPVDSIHVGQVLLCKIRGFSEWPAYVNNIHNGIVNVTFFGDKTTTKTTMKHLYSFTDSVDFLVYMVQKKKIHCMQDP